MSMATLKVVKPRRTANRMSTWRPEGQLHKLMIPNRELKGIYENRILSWFRVRTVSDTVVWKKFCESVKTGDVSQVQKLLNGFMADSITTGILQECRLEV